MRHIFILLFFALAACNYTGDKQFPENVPTDPIVEKTEAGDTISVIAVGDMMLGTNYPDRKKFTTKNILSTLSSILQDADFTIGNLEGVLASDTLESKKCKDKKNCYAFRSPPTFVHYFKQAGFDFLSLANNHSGDFDNEGLRQTMKVLDSAGIQYAGLKNICEYTILEKEGLKLGIIGVGHSWRHVYINDYDHISSLIKTVKQKADVAVVFFHGGAEGSHAEHVPKAEEKFYSESRGNVHQLARVCVDAGADLVIGSGPHVTRAMELYKGRLIAYSLGNFATYGKISLNGPMGIAPILKIHISKSGAFLSGRIIPTLQKPLNPSTPMLDSAGSVIQKLIHLSAQDFPNSRLIISQDGNLTLYNFDFK